MASEYHWFGEDTVFSASGDDLSTSGVEELNQRILRGLMTSPGEYVWHPEYGSGLGRFVGRALSPELRTEIIGLVRGVVLAEPEVQKQPEPTITLNSDANGFASLQISYVYAPTAEPQTITFKLA